MFDVHKTIEVFAVIFLTIGMHWSIVEFSGLGSSSVMKGSSIRSNEENLYFTFQTFSECNSDVHFPVVLTILCVVPHHYYSAAVILFTDLLEYKLMHRICHCASTTTIGHDEET